MKIGGGFSISDTLSKELFDKRQGVIKMFCEVAVVRQDKIFPKRIETTLACRGLWQGRPDGF
jgi:hypothetical protein